MARPRATRCFCPPESSFGLLSSNSVSSRDLATVFTLDSIRSSLADRTLSGLGNARVDRKAWSWIRWNVDLAWLLRSPKLRLSRTLRCG